MKQAQNRHDLAAGIDDKTAVAVHEDLDSQRKAPSDRTGKAQSSAASQGKGKGRGENEKALRAFASGLNLSLIQLSEPTRQAEISYAVFCLKKKQHTHTSN